MRILIVVLIVLMSVGSASALEISDYSVDYDVQASGEILETLEIIFSSPLEESTMNSLTIGNARDVSVFADSQELEIEVSENGGGVTVVFETPAGTSTLLVKFTVSELVFQSGGVYQFFTELIPPEVETLEMRITLPKGFVVFRDIYFPGGAEIGTDGERIYFYWTFQDVTEPVIVSVQFEPAVSVNTLLVPGILAGAVVVILIVFLYFRRKRSQDFLLTFFEDERKVILSLKGEKVCYQNTLEKKLGFSRAKMTRIVQKLERKSLLKKEKAGRTNRLKWKG